jgi:hypothetical protein
LLKKKRQKNALSLNLTAAKLKPAGNNNKDEASKEEFEFTAPTKKKSARGLQKGNITFKSEAKKLRKAAQGGDTKKVIEIMGK